MNRTQRQVVDASDAATVRNAVSSLDTSRLGEGVPWSNPATGSSGIISGVSETTDRGGLCRTFDTSRVTYDGIVMFHGRACMDGRGGWSLVAFEPA